MTVPVEVVHGTKEGPTLFVSAAVHGDEINGVEIIRQLLCKKALNNIRGTLLAVPIVNVFGFNNKSRYLPDRRDLNRNFPGSENGSMTSQLAHTFMTEIVERCTHGIDLHCAAVHRDNLPQIRACLDDPETLRMAHAFNVPVLLHSTLRDGSLREATRERNIPTLLFEGGEALRFNDNVIKSGVKGVISVMREIGMLKSLKKIRKAIQHEAFVARSSYWIRSPYSGIMTSNKKLGERVKKGQTIGYISDPFGHDKFEIKVRRGGIIIGATNLPLLSRGMPCFILPRLKISARSKSRSICFGKLSMMNKAFIPS